jgi:hypothetical protein
MREDPATPETSLLNLLWLEREIGRDLYSDELLAAATVAVELRRIIRNRRLARENP